MMMKHVSVCVYGGVFPLSCHCLTLLYWGVQRCAQTHLWENLGVTAEVWPGQLEQAAAHPLLTHADC